MPPPVLAECKHAFQNQLQQDVTLAPGSRGALLHPSPLRTVREGLPSHGSSLEYPITTSLVMLMVTV
jgi:hypothetical protein